MSRIRMFAIKILLGGVPFVAILGPTPIFRQECVKKLKFMLFIIMLQCYNFCLFFQCICEFGLFKVLKSHWILKLTIITIISHPDGQKIKGFG